MTADRFLDRQLSALFDERASASAPDGLLQRSLARVDATRQRAGWLVGDRGRSPQTTGRLATAPARAGLSRWRFPSMNRFAPLALAATAVVVIVLIGIGLILRSPNVGPSPVPGPSHAATPEPSAQPKAAVIVFMTRTGVGPQLWVANLDGTGAHELAPDLGGYKGLPSWSPDGTRLLFSRIEFGITDLGDPGTRLYLTDASGSTPQMVDTGCVRPCVSDSHGVFSSDGRQILFLRLNVVDAPPSATPAIAGKPAPAMQVRVLASMDLATGRVVELGSFPASYPSAPDWSPDRTQVLFNRQVFSHIPPGTSQEIGQEVLVADADGRNVHRVSPSAWSSFSGGWSPDGAHILFQGIQYTQVGTGSSDIYTVRPDGTDLRRLTTGGISSNAAWSVDGRIWFIRGDASGLQYWVMDADGSHATQLSGPPQPQDLADAAMQPAP